jgi:hypothetical protein
MLFALHRSRRNTDHRAKCEFKTMNLPEGNWRINLCHLGLAFFFYTQ